MNDTRMTFLGFPPVTDAELLRLSDLNPGWAFERDDEGAIAVSPTFWKSGSISAKAGALLTRWAEGGPSGMVFDSSTGFRMSTGAVRCPDAAWVSAERLDAAELSHPDDFFPGSPDIAIEIASSSDSWSDLTAKIDMYVREGSIYAIAIDSATNRIYVRGTPPAGLYLDVAALKKARL